uniref:Putative nuclease n=1 Tax=viral metagenome TaxID=1070528 RepID=A0A6H1ZW85_9ZZZZ
MIVIDIFEPKNIVHLIKELGIPVIQKKLDVGDYAWANIGVERKSSQDFFSSIWSREPEHNLFSQLYQLKQYEIPILIIQGNLFTQFKYVGRKRVSIPAKEYKMRIKTAYTILSKLPIRYKIYHYIVPNLSSFVQLVHSLYLNTLDTESYAPVKRKGKTLPEIKENMICCIPGFGRKTSRALLEEIPSIKELCNILESEFYYPRLEEKIGVKKSSKLRECLTK